MVNGNIQLSSRQCTSSVEHQHTIKLVLKQHVPDLIQHASRHFAVVTAMDINYIVTPGNAKLVGEDIRNIA